MDGKTWHFSDTFPVHDLSLIHIQMCIRDRDKAKELMAEAGYEDGFDITITVPSNYQKHIDTAQVIAQQLKQINVNATIEPVEWGQWLEQVYTNADYQTTVVGLTGKLDPNDILGRYVSDYAKNFMKYNNPDYDKLIEEAKTASDAVSYTQLMCIRDSFKRRQRRPDGRKRKQKLSREMAL